MTPKRPPRADRYLKMAKETAVRVLPPLIVVALLMLFWELVCRRTGSPLAAPSQTAAFESLQGHQGTDLRSVLRPRWDRQGLVLAPVCQPAARGPGLFAG